MEHPRHIAPLKDTPPFHDFSISRHCWETIRPLIQPGISTLECGSGLSTLLFDAAGAVHTALEHDARYAAPSASVQLLSLSGNPKWYDWEPPHAYDLIFIDGPPESIGRGGILRVIEQCTHDRSVIAVDDVHRPAEQQLLSQILQISPRTPRLYRGDRRDFAICLPQ